MDTNMKPLVPLPETDHEPVSPTATATATTTTTTSDQSSDPTHHNKKQQRTKNKHDHHQVDLMALANVSPTAQSLDQVPALLDLIHARRLCFLCCHGLRLIANQTDFDALLASAPSSSTTPPSQEDTDDALSPPRCMLCLDILADLPALCDSLLSQLVPIAADFGPHDAFRLELVLPRCLAFRRLVFARTFALPFVHRDWEVKHAVAATLVPFLERGLARTHAADAPLHFTVLFTHDLNSELPDPRATFVAAAAAAAAAATSDTPADLAAPPALPSRREKRKLNERSKRSGGGPVIPDVVAGTVPFTHLLPVTSPMRQSDLRFRREPIYLGGRYLKLARPIAQTAWVIDGKRKTELSVGECIGDAVCAAARASDVTLVAAGREDADVRMVGRGRPFYLEVKNPRCTVFDPVAIAKEVNTQWAGKVQVSQLGWVSKSDLKLVKVGEEMKPKTYACLLWIHQPTASALAHVNAQRDLLVHQRTPTRVLHRRPNVVRDKVIHEITLTPVTDDAAHGFFRAVLKTQAGTYIKEFCHGDFGRTQPSLRTLLGTEVDILELDVVDIDLEWPPMGPAQGSSQEEGMEIAACSPRQ